MRAPRRLLVAAAAAATAVALVGVPTPTAVAVGDGNPVITSPTASEKHYAGFDGPFVTSFANAPIGTYDYWVERNGTVVGPVRQYAFNGSFETPQLVVDKLPVATGYTFHVTDHGDPVEHATSLAFTVSPGQPPTCAILLPARVRMTGRSALVRARLGATCTTLRTDYASWQANDPRGFFAERFTFADGARTDTWRIFDDERTGTYVVRPSVAKDVDNKTLPQNTTRTTLKMDGRARFTATRVGRTVTLRATLTRYSPVRNTYVAWAHRKVVVAARSCATCPWQHVGSRTTDRSGKVSLKVRSAKVRQYRVTGYATASTWAPLPRYVRR